MKITNKFYKIKHFKTIPPCYPLPFLQTVRNTNNLSDEKDIYELIQKYMFLCSIFFNKQKQTKQGSFFYLTTAAC